MDFCFSSYFCIPNFPYLIIKELIKAGRENANVALNPTSVISGFLRLTMNPAIFYSFLFALAVRFEGSLHVSVKESVDGNI